MSREDITIVSASVSVRNMPNHAVSGYVVVRYVDTDLWYYGVYGDEETAQKVAIDIKNGFVIYIPEDNND